MLDIRLEKVSKRYGANWIIRKATFDFNAGATYALQGPNGSGKSTLIKILAGYLSPSYGKVLYQYGNGNLLTREEVYKQINLSAPYVELIESLKVDEMIDFQSRLKPFLNNWKTEDVLDFCYLTDFRKLYLWELSSGMLQRLKISLCIASASSALFLDEPGTNLDQKAKSWFLQSLVDMQGGRTVIIASNEQQDFPAKAIPLSIEDFK